jgi:hypothetical protein
MHRTQTVPRVQEPPTLAQLNRQRRLLKIAPAMATVAAMFGMMVPLSLCSYDVDAMWLDHVQAAAN